MTDPIKLTDAYWMQRALAQAGRGVGLTRPNPPVGAVIVHGDRIVAEGYHKRAGLEHAEKVALRRAGAAARGATLYVTLEPCCTTGRTPPCTDRIIECGITRVVAAIADPNPKHHKQGFAILRRAGIEVKLGVCRREAEELLAPFSQWILNKRPLVSLKLATTADGRIADGKGNSRWITGSESRREVQQLRRTADAVMVGINTIQTDNPCLLPSPAFGRKPWRVIVDSQAKISCASRVITEHADQTIVATTELAASNKLKCIRERGVTVITCRADNGRVDLHDLLGRLGEMGILHVLCEGGGRLAAALMQEDLVDRLFLFIAPTLLGSSGVPALDGVFWSMTNKPGFAWDDVRRVGGDVLLSSQINHRR